MKQRTNRAFFADDGGFGTVGMVLALLISVSLVVGSAQVYRIRSVAADIQNVADACALAAEKQVASFYLVAQVCDCAVFSLALAGTATVGLGIVVAFIPPAEAISAKLVDAGKAILDARTRFARACTSGLNRLQTLLPLFAAIDAAAVASANSNSESAYHAIAVLCPFEGDEVSEPPQDESLPDDVDERRRRISEAASDAEESQRKADAHKLAAFMADCGNSPSYCMYERAETLAGMGGQRNPHYSSVDAWSFGVALSRARDYYWERYLKEVPLSEDVDELARSAIRERFYAYAVNTLAEGYVTETQDAFSAYFPLLPRNTDEMRSTWLYTEGAYPVTEDAEGFRTTHAFEGCPGASEELFVGMGSVELMEAEGMERCPVCRFAASSVGKVAAASTSIDNGFEYHYHVVAREAELYEQERGRLDEKRRAAQEPAQGLFDTLSRLLGAASESRIKVAPPGRIGAIAVVFDSGGFSASDVVATTLVSSGSTLGMRAAISAATLADDDASEAETVVSSLLDGVLSEAMPAQVFDAALGMWSGMLVGYTKGTEALLSNVEFALGSLPLLGSVGLGRWASGKLKDAISSAGLDPPDLVSHKPVLVNTYHVALAESGAFSQGLLGAKDAMFHAYGGIAQDPLSALVGIAGGKILSSYQEWDATFVIARIELLGSDGPSIPIEITLPPAIKDGGAHLIERALSSMLEASGQMVEVRRWE